MIIHADSCSWTTGYGSGPFNGQIIKYVAQLSGFGVGIETGRDQLAYNGFNCHAIYTKVLGPRSVWRDSRSFLVNALNPINGPAEVNIWSYSSGGACLATVSLTKAGYLKIYQGGDGNNTLGALMYTSQAPLTVEEWHSIDLDWDFPSGAAHGKVSLYIDDVLDTLNPGQPSVPNAVWGGVPDRFAIVAINNGFSQSGWFMCDLVVSDDQGESNTARLGPCRVERLTFTQDQLIAWLAQINGAMPASSFAAIDEYPGNAPPGAPNGYVPDLDYSTIYTATSGVENFFGIPSVSCYAGILGVAMTVCIRDPSSGAIDLVVRPNPRSGMDYLVGSISPVPTIYAALQAITELNPATGGVWLDGAIQNAWWGVNALEGQPSITQFLLEKVTTRRNVPYNCGKLGSYSYSGTPSVAV